MSTVDRLVNTEELDNSGLEHKTNEEVVNALEEQVSEEKDKPSFELPEKFKGKTAEEIAKSYVELEKMTGRQAQELGELRRLADEYIKTQLSEGKSKKEEEVDDIDFLEKPEEAVSKVIEKHPALNKIQELELKIAEKEFASKHPDYKDIAKTPEFAEWVAASDFRKDLYARADSFDFKAADELFTLWKERQELLKSVSNKEEEIKKEERKKQLKDAAAESGSSGATSKKKFRRSELIRLRMTDPDKYYAMQDEILQAYKEGRVI